MTRLGRLRARMEETGTDLVALGPTAHMRWLAGLDPHGDERPVMLLVSRRHAGLLMPALNAGAARAATDLPMEAWDDADGPDAALARLLAACGPARRVAVDEGMRADHALLLLDAARPERRGFLGDTVGRLRARKDAEEVAGLRASARVNDGAMAAGFAALRTGITEREVAAAVAAHYAAHGARRLFTIVAFGANAAFPHHHAGDRRLGEDEAVLIDTGGIVDGWPSDMTRTRWHGASPDPEFLRARDVVERAVRAALDAARPGARARDVDRAARDVIAAGGLGHAFVHRTGHGLGLETHEPPWITATSEAVLEEGMVFSIEPGVYLPGRWGIRLEDVVALGPDGASVLSGMARTGG